jgi:hypothetical protein
VWTVSDEAEEKIKAAVGVMYWLLEILHTP